MIRAVVRSNWRMDVQWLQSRPDLIHELTFSCRLRSGDRDGRLGRRSKRAFKWPGLYEHWNPRTVSETMADLCQLGWSR